MNDFNDRINRLREIIEDARPHVSRLVADIITTSFDQPINREQVRSWRERVNIRVAADAGFAYEGYIRLKLASVRSFISSLIAALRGVPAKSPFAHAIAEIIDAWAIATGMVYDEERPQAMHLETAAAQPAPRWVNFLLAFDVDYRKRHLMSRPGMRFVPIKSPEQQAMLMLHKTRELLTKQRTMSVNALRGHLSEFGIVAAKGIGRVDELLDLANSDATLPVAAKAGVNVLAQALEGLDTAINALENEIANADAQNETVRLLDKVPGVGKLIASVIAASVPDPSVFKSGRDFAAWLGLTPDKTQRRQADARDHNQAGQPIHKEDARSWGRPRCSTSWVSAKAPCATGLSGCWRKSRRGLVTVALANKLARILWAMMKTGECFRTEMFAKA